MPLVRRIALQKVSLKRGIKKGTLLKKAWKIPRLLTMEVGDCLETELITQKGKYRLQNYATRLRKLRGWKMSVTRMPKGNYVICRVK